MFKIITVCVLFCIFLSTSIVSGLDENSAKEKRCFKDLPPPFKKINGNWAQSISTWYKTHSGRLEYYRLAGYVEHLPISEINEDDLYYHGCFLVLWETDKFPIVQGFHGKTGQVVLQHVSEGIFKYNPSNYEIGGTAVLTLTDNKTFQFFYKCYDDGEATWTVLSTKPDLDQKTKNIIHEHAKSLGFNEKYFTEMKFETCNESKGKKDEL